jgi:DNA-binding MarR family transcriptional regulator
MRNNGSEPRKDHRLIYLLSVAQRRVQRAAAANSAEAVSPAQAGLLFVLGRQDGVLMGEAGAALDLGPAGTSGLVDRMAAAGLIERRADDNDARAWRVFLTPKGRKSLLRAKEVAGEMNARLAHGFSDAEIDIVARWLTSIQSKFPRGDSE